MGSKSFNQNLDTTWYNPIVVGETPQNLLSSLGEIHISFLRFCLQLRCWSTLTLGRLGTLGMRWTCWTAKQLLGETWFHMVWMMKSHEQYSKPLLVDDLIGDYTTQYIGDYNNPIGESLLTNQYFMEWQRGFEHCSHEIPIFLASFHLLTFFFFK